MIRCKPVLAVIQVTVPHEGLRARVRARAAAPERVTVPHEGLRARHDQVVSTHRLL